MDQHINDSFDKYSAALHRLDDNTILGEYLKRNIEEINHNINKEYRVVQTDPTHDSSKQQIPFEKKNPQIKSQIALRTQRALRQKFEKLVIENVDLSKISPYIDNFNETLRLKPFVKENQQFDKTMYKVINHLDNSFDKNDIFNAPPKVRKEKKKYVRKAYNIRKEKKYDLDIKCYSPKYTVIDKKIRTCFINPITTNTEIRHPKPNPMCPKLPKIKKATGNYFNLTKTFQFDKYIPRDYKFLYTK